MRKSKLTPERQSKIVEAIQVGNYKHVAAEYAGIGESTFYSWLERGELEKEQGKTTIYTEFMEAVKKAEAASEVANIALIKKAAPTNWQAAAWLEERKHWQRWGREDKQQVEVTNKTDLKELTDEELDQLQKDIAAAEAT